MTATYQFLLNVTSRIVLLACITNWWNRHVYYAKTRGGISTLCSRILKMVKRFVVLSFVLQFITGMSSSHLLADTIVLRDGEVISGEFLDTGICGVGVYVRPGFKYSVTRCVYEGNKGGISLDFIDGRWLDLDEALGDFDVRSSLKYCLEFNKELFGVSDNVPDFGEHQNSSFRSYLNTLMKSKVIKSYRKNVNNTAIWFYMRFVHIVDDEGIEQYIPLKNVAEIKDGFEKIIPLKEFLEKKKEDINIQATAIGVSLEAIKKETIFAIMFLPATPDGPDWNLNYTNRRNTLIARTLLKSFWFHSNEIKWRRRYLAILNYAR